MLARLSTIAISIGLLAINSIAQAALVKRDFTVEVTNVSGFTTVSVGDILPFSYTFETTTPEDSLSSAENTFGGDESTFALYTDAVIEMTLGSFDPVSSIEGDLLPPENFISISDGQPNAATNTAYQDSYAVVIRNELISGFYGMSFGATNITDSTADDFIDGVSIITVPTDWLRDVTGDTQVQYTEAGNLLTAKLVSVNEVPVPGAVWLFGSGLLGLIGVARRKKS